MQCRVEERMIRRVRVIVVKCFKYGEEGHKCKEYPLREKKLKRVACPVEGKAHQGKRGLVCSIRKKAQEGEKRLRRVKEKEAVHIARP